MGFFFDLLSFPYARGHLIVPRDNSPTTDGPDMIDGAAAVDCVRTKHGHGHGCERGKNAVYKNGRDRGRGTSYRVQWYTRVRNVLRTTKRGEQHCGMRIPTCRAPARNATFPDSSVGVRDDGPAVLFYFFLYIILFYYCSVFIF